MINHIDIKSLTKKEKIVLMEQLWEDMNSCIAPPEWHHKALKETEDRIASGEEKFLDWSTAKEMLRKRT